MVTIFNFVLTIPSTEMKSKNIGTMETFLIFI